MVAGIKSERWPTSNRNPWPECVGIRKLFSARHYDRFLPSDTTLQAIRQDLIQIDIRTAIIYGSATTRTNVIGNLYEKLIDDELRSSLGAVYTPDQTMRFMVDLAERNFTRFRGHKIVEPACGSGHFYREIYRRYVAEVQAQSTKSGFPAGLLATN
jgi:type I restriction-modification system DNA methylase subunit